MRDYILAAGPWVGGPMTKTHRKVLVARVSGAGLSTCVETDRSSGLPVGVVPAEFALYTQSDEGVLGGGTYFYCDPGESWRKTMLKALHAFSKSMLTYAESYTPHVLVTAEGY